MRPDNNPNLYQAVGEPRISALNEEFLRRSLVYSTLEDLSSEFNSADGIMRPITEPSLLTRLFTLSLIQRTHMGVVGFHPLDTVRAQHDTIEAEAAPFHDEFSLESGTYRTRVIRLSMPDDENGEVEIFGLNFFQPDLNLDLDFGLNSDSNKLLVVGEKGLIGEQCPINGETVILGVRNIKTNDAKLYKVDVDKASTYNTGTQNQTVYQVSEYKIAVTLPDNTVMVVEQLTDEQQQEAVREFQKSVETLKAQPLPTDGMTEAEIDAISGIHSRHF